MDQIVKERLGDNLRDRLTEGDHLPAVLTARLDRVINWARKSKCQTHPLDEPKTAV